MFPNLLYKYLSPERTDVLRRRRIRFTQPCFLNDPFEFRPAMPAAPAHFEAKIAKRREAACEDELRNAGVLSLTETRASVLMWAHYAAEHRGFVIGFETGSSFFNKAIADGKLQRMRYRRERISLTRGLLPNQPWVKPDAIFWTKNPEWAYEREWRWVERGNPPDYSEVRSGQDNQPLYLRPIPSESMREIILGHRTDPKTAEEIRALKSTAGYEHLRLFRAVLSKGDYSLEIEPL